MTTTPVLSRYPTRLASTLALVVWLAGVPAALLAQGQTATQGSEARTLQEQTHAGLATLKDAFIGLPVATVLGAALAFRPRRRGTPPRSSAVIQTQIVLALIGAVVMLVVGASLARAFGVAGVAGLIRYRAKIDDPKDASVMLASLAMGLASGVGLYVLAGFATVFVLGVLWALESIEPRRAKIFALTIASKAPVKAQPAIEQLLRRHHATFEMRSNTPEEIVYEVRLPIEKKTDSLSNAILKMSDTTAVEWSEKTKKEKSEQ